MDTFETVALVGLGVAIFVHVLIGLLERAISRGVRNAMIGLNVALRIENKEKSTEIQASLHD